MFEKVPDERQCGSIADSAVDKQYQLPRPASSDGSAFEMEDANYMTLLELLQNPRMRAFMLTAVPYEQSRRQIESAKEDVPHAAAQREVRREGNDPADIDVAQYEVIRKNRHEFAVICAASLNSANEGRASSSRLIECRRCHHKLQGHYDSQGRVTYSCPHGRR